ncbi:uncharacterized protein LOC111865494 isoform X3 [Cryptotermes secundus]|uniref:uncharacterized protein LOC111865494 isoform X3 n=1 Tax=Cryptotermes secundus TaxID=105785 RepID=UPI001454DAE4|nr:uncharacterized protein LOC111865494 isoform X3 [Cryptotermes secundus]
MDVLEGILTWSQAEKYRNGAVLAEQTSFLADHNDKSSGTDDIKLESSFSLRRQRKYSWGEQKDIVECVVRHGAYGLLRGTAFWKMMEEKMVCNKRTWQSMKEQFFKKILPDIESFNLSESQISRFKNLKSSNSLRHWERQSLKSSALEEPSDQLNRNANYYTEAEDKALLNFVVQRERYSETGGVRLWKLMERKQVLPGRSWQSMKERYRKVLTRKLDQYLPSDVVNQIMKAEIRGSKWKMKKRKPSVAACMLSPRSHEIYSMQMTEPESDISKTQPNCLALDCTCCSNSSTNTSIKSIKSTVPVVSGTPNKREPPKNPIHSPKRKLFSQRKSLVEFTPVSEDKRRKQSSKYIYKPNLQIHHLTKGNRKRDAKGCNRVTKVAAVANAQKESQPNEDMAPYGTRKSDVVVCNTKCTCQGIGTHQKNSGFAAQTMDATSECEEVRNLEQPVSSEHQGNSTDWFESSTDNSDSPVQESGSSGHDLHEACCSLTASTISTDDSCAMFSHSNAYKKLRKKRWKETADCSICDRTQNMEPCMPDI